MLQAEPDESDDESADSASLPSTPSAVESSAEHAGSEPTSDSAPPSTTGNSGSDVHPSSSAKRPRSRSGSTTPTVSRADQPVVKKSRSEDVAEDTVRTAFGGPSTGTGTLLVNYAGEIEHVKSEVGTSSMATTEPPRTGSADQGGNNTDRGREGQVNPAIAGPSTQTLPTDRSSDDTTIDPVLVLFRHLLGYQAAVQAANGVYRSGDLMGMTAYLGDISGWVRQVNISEESRGFGD